ncbi:MAG: hypothetical protein KF729_06970 [Sandaracinaceae bacterium]|nr:hypothetical protein [Sandaracinaceae bacterium]
MGKEVSPDDPLAPNGPAAGWSELAIDTAAIRSGTHPRPVHDAGADAGGRIVGDPFAGLDDAPIPDLELDLGAPPLPAPDLPAGPAPSGARPAAPRPIDDVEVAALADYGDPPASFVGWVPYAILVTQRRRALSRALAELRRLRETAARDAREARVELGRALHRSRDVDALRVLGPQIAVCDETGRAVSGRAEAWTEAREAADAQRASLASKIEEAERASGPYRDRETKLATQMTSREAELRRAKAKLARVEIELRNLRSVGEAAGALDAPRLELLEAELVARRADVQKAQGHVDDLEPQLAQARRELAVVLSAQNDLEEQRRAVDRAQDRTERAHSSSATEAETRYHEAAEALADAALSRALAEPVAPREARGALTMERALAAREREIELHERALRAYDHSAYPRGVAVIGIAALIVLVMIVTAIVR